MPMPMTKRHTVDVSTPLRVMTVTVCEFDQGIRYLLSFDSRGHHTEVHLSGSGFDEIKALLAKFEPVVETSPKLTVVPEDAS